jgi:MFS family permease
MTPYKHLSIEQDPEVAKTNPDRFRVGTLSYTKAGLITVFLYLLWGDFCFSLMETVVPSIMPLKLNSLGAPNWLLGLICTTVPNIMNMFGNPLISFRSDRLRSRWGRRIPFLAGATPFLVLFLIALGFSEQISRWMESTVIGGGWSHYTVILTVISVFMISFGFFNLFISSVYYYLFNDVVPHAFLARFMALFRVVGGGAGALYSFFVLKYAISHMHYIFLGAGLLYLVAFAIMCWKIKEGGYPPPEPYVGRGSGFVSALKTYASECFAHRFYWLLFLANSCYALTWVSGAYGLLTATKVMGLDLSLCGKVGGVCGVIGMAALYPAGILADRLHPLRMQLAAVTAMMCSGLLGIIFIFNCHNLDHRTIVAIWIGFSAIGLPIGVLYGASELPALMKLLPQDRFGQFCSANAMIRSIVLIFAGVSCGAFLDFTKRFGANPDDCYRFVSVWNFCAQASASLFLFLLYREWKRLGGLHGYRPPGATVAESTP